MNTIIRGHCETEQPLTNAQQTIMRTCLPTGAFSRAVGDKAMGNDGTLEDHAVRGCHSLGASVHRLCSCLGVGMVNEIQIAFPDPCFLVCCLCARKECQ